MVLYCWLVLFSFCAFINISRSDDIVDSEVRALKDVMESLKPYPFWDLYPTDLCPWSLSWSFIVSCSFDGHVISLVSCSEYAMSLSGSISRSIGNLTYLQTLLLPNNNLSGTIPSEIGMLQKIETIDLSNNLLTGEIPSSLSQLNALQYLLLPNNNLSGTIPSEIGMLQKVEKIDLSHNLLTGEIPSSLSQLKALQYLFLPNNNLSGTIPSEIGMLQKVEKIDLSHNLLTGEIPSSLSQLKALQYLDLSFNNLSGPAPRLLAKTHNILGNPMICATGKEPECFGTTPMPNIQPSVKPKINKVILAFATSVCCICLLIVGFGFLLWWRQKHSQQILVDVNEQHHGEACLGNLRSFQFRELEIATSSFSSKNILGKGAFGNVYKGNLEDGSIVAVKRLKTGNEIRGEIQFQTEVKLISHAVHRNILRLYGFCITTTERLLVYPYMSNGSVASRLKAKPPLDWGTRKRIALGAAGGLHYLHEQCDSKIIHRDVKAANILLDDNCEAVVGDFGLAKLLGHLDSHVTTAVRGTVGHIAPEYLSTGQSSEKTDVFGYGIFLLELITGQRATEFCKAANLKGPMLDWVKKIHQEKKLEMLVDKKLKNNYDSSELEEMTKVALLCTLRDQNHRPKMCEVVGMLQGDGDGLAEKWESSQSAEAKRCKENECSSSERPHDFTDDSSSLLVKAVEILRGWKRMGNQ